MQDVVIIGGGLRGLTCGALLAQRGHSVTLLEQHTVVGGAATCFKRKGGFHCEVGLHEMDDPFGPGKKEIFDELKVYDHIRFERIPEFYRVLLDDRSFTIPDDAAQAREMLTSHFPAESENIDRYFQTIEAIGSELNELSDPKWYKLLLFPLFYPHMLRYAPKTAADLTGKLIHDPLLELLLQANVGYYAPRAKELSALYHAVAQSSYFRGGGWFIRGGSQTLSDYLAQVIRDHGGEVITSAQVERITVQDGQARGVVYQKRGQNVTVEAKTVVSNASPLTVYHDMLDAKYSDPKLEGRTIAESILSIYVGFSKNLKKVYGPQPYSNFFFGNMHSVADYDAQMGKPVEERGFVFVDYSQIDSGLAPEGKSFGVICTTDFLKDWESLDDSVYRQKKEQVAESYFKKIEQTYPGIRELVEFYEVGTPKTMQRYLQTPNGTAYGFAPTPQQLRSRWPVKSRTLPHLFFTGAWTFGGGFTPAIMSGKMSAEAVEKVL